MTRAGMSRFMRALSAVPAVALLLVPLSAAAASPSPTPSVRLSPTLDRVLVAPPSGYAALSGSGLQNGHFTAHDWTQGFGAKAAEGQRLMGQDGFVDGYNVSWASQSTRHILNEFVLAFAGGKGAAQWFAYQKGYDTSTPQFQHADTISGIPQYYGVHETESSVYGQAYLDGFLFLKGNDLVGVAVVSLSDDNLTLATNQTKSQYAAAPGSTIPEAQWPENAQAPASASPVAATSSGGLGKVLPYALIIGAALIAIGLGAALLLTRVRRSPSAAPAAQPFAPIAGTAPVATAAAPAIATAAAASPTATLPLQMSADGNYWYDGERWVDVNQEAPPFAQRSPDGAFWWDGYSWRPVPLAQPPVSGR